MPPPPLQTYSNLTLCADQNPLVNNCTFAPPSTSSNVSYYAPFLPPSASLLPQPLQPLQHGEFDATQPLDDLYDLPLVDSAPLASVEHNEATAAEWHYEPELHESRRYSSSLAKFNKARFSADVHASLSLSANGGLIDAPRRPPNSTAICLDDPLSHLPQSSSSSYAAVRASRQTSPSSGCVARRMRSALNVAIRLESALCTRIADRPATSTIFPRSRATMRSATRSSCRESTTCASLRAECRQLPPRRRRARSRRRRRIDNR